MTEKQWTNYELVVNGLTQQIQYNKATVENLFLPLLSKLTQLQNEKGKRVIMFLAAPPATGKSTLTLFLEKLSRENKELTPVQAIGLDGFHYHADYIKSHSILRNGQEIPMSEVKGCPETFDTEKLHAKLSALQNQNVLWPIYDRKMHDVVEDVQKVTGDIILLEGNWLLLKDEAWQDMRSFADYTLLISANPNLLKHRLIARKMQGGLSETDATAFYEKSDSVNVERTLQDSEKADETWTMLEDNDYIKA